MSSHMDRLIQDTIHDPSTLNIQSICELSREECSAVARDMRAFHHSQWVWLRLELEVGMDVVSDSMCTFLCCARSEPILDEPDVLGDFDQVQLESKWTHPMLTSIPVSRMSQMHAMDTLEGLEWHMLSSLLHAPRGAAWLTQVRRLIELLKSRLCFMCLNETDVLNVPELCEPRNVMLVNETNNFESDEERYIARRKDVPNKRSRLFDDDIEYPNILFVGILDTRLTAMEFALYHAWILRDIPIAVNRDVHPFRSWLFARAEGMDIGSVAAARSLWVESLMVTWSHRRVYMLQRGTKYATNTRQILLSKNESLISPRISTFKELHTRSPKNAAMNMQLSTDAMLMLVSQSYGDPVRAVYVKEILGELPTHMCIFRCAVMDGWIAQMSHRERRLCASLTHAFIELRAMMQEHGVTNVHEGRDMSGLDTHFEQPS